MRQSIIKLSVILLSTFVSISFAQTKNDVTVYCEPVPGQRCWVRVIPYTHNIVRVVASPQEEFPTRQSLVVLREPEANLEVQRSANKEILTVETRSLKVQISKKSGDVSFYSKRNYPLLQEAPGGRSIVPALVLGESTYHVQQQFVAKPREAFYGLGQHQNGYFNYRGKDVDLWQYNIVSVVPFLVSNSGYGILWDNYSRTKFGDTRDYQSLEDARLYTSDGSKRGFTAEYFTDEQCQNLYTQRTESRIQHAYIDDNDPFPEGFSEQVKAVRWSGSLEAERAGIYKFRLYCSGYTKMWINGKLVVDSWRQNWLPWTHYSEIFLKKGERCSITLEWIHSGGYISLEYLPPTEKPNSDIISLASEVADAIDYYFIAGETLDSVIAAYRWLTGDAPMMPKWALGLWQCRERYKTQEELLNVVREFRKRSIPLDNIVQDWFYWPEDRWGDHDFDVSRYPDPAGMIRTLHDSLQTHIMISVWPKFYVGTKHYEEMKANGWLYMRNVEKEQRDWVGPGYVSTFYDPYSEGARTLYWQQINKKLFSLGIDAWWLDCTEPDIQSNLSRTETILRQHPTALGSGARYLNTYSLMTTRAVYEGQRATKPEQRVFILTRSAFAGQQRYAATTWSGDVAARWHDLKMQIPAGLNFSLSGIPYWTTDIGGFAVEPRFEQPDSVNLEEWRELMTRWFQFGTFCPIFRVHGQYPYREMFYVAPPDHPAHIAMLSYDRLRYRLLPYIYSLAGMVTHRGYTIMRALVMDFMNDTNVVNIGDQFMFGPSLLVNPVVEYKERARPVYLPAGNGWYEFKTGKYYRGGQWIVAEAPYTDIPLFVREGSILLTGPDLQYTAEKPAEPLRLFVCTGRNASFELYEDGGETYEYEKGAYSWIPLQYDEKTKTLTIGARKGSFHEMLNERTFEIVWITPDTKRGIDWTSTPDAIVHYNGNPITLTMQ